MYAYFRPAHTPWWSVSVPWWTGKYSWWRINAVFLLEQFELVTCALRRSVHEATNDLLTRGCQSSRTTLFIDLLTFLPDYFVDLLHWKRGTSTAKRSIESVSTVIERSLQNSVFSVHNGCRQTVIFWTIRLQNWKNDTRKRQTWFYWIKTTMYITFADPLVRRREA